MDEYIERKKVLSKAAPVVGCFSDMISVYDVIMLPRRCCPCSAWAMDTRKNGRRFSHLEM